MSKRVEITKLATGVPGQILVGTPQQRQMR